MKLNLKNISWKHLNHLNGIRIFPYLIFSGTFFTLSARIVYQAACRLMYLSASNKH